MQTLITADVGVLRLTMMPSPGSRRASAVERLCTKPDSFVCYEMVTASLSMTVTKRFSSVSHMQ